MYIYKTNETSRDAAYTSNVNRSTKQASLQTYKAGIVTDIEIKSSYNTHALARTESRFSLHEQTAFETWDARMLPRGMQNFLLRGAAHLSVPQFLASVGCLTAFKLQQPRSLASSAYHPSQQ